MQTTSHILMIRPVNFTFNAETAVNNAFQSATNDDSTQGKALAEFEAFVKMLRDNGIDVIVVDDTPEPYTPDSIFPNNWVSFHQEGIVCLYPMYARNRRLERKPGVLRRLEKDFRMDTTMDFSAYEKDTLFLEGTGSMVLDRDSRIAYACLSPRTDRQVLEDFCIKMDYQPEVFVAVDDTNNPIYHTNVLMCIGEGFALVGTDAIAPDDRALVLKQLRASGREIVEIGLDEVERFAGNMLELATWDEALGDSRVLVMSASARDALTADAYGRLSACTDTLLVVPVPTIEKLSGGSVRCMLAEIFLPA